MKLYQKQRRSNGQNVGDPGPLPREIEGWTDEALADPMAVAPQAMQELGLHQFKWIPVEPPPPVPTAPDLPLEAFYRLLTMAEFTSLLTAAKTDVQLEAFLELARARESVRLDNPSTIAAVTYAKDKKLINQTRASQILAGQAPT